MTVVSNLFTVSSEIVNIVVTKTYNYFSHFQCIIILKEWLVLIDTVCLLLKIGKNLKISVNIYVFDETTNNVQVNDLSGVFIRNELG